MSAVKFWAVVFSITLVWAAFLMFMLYELAMAAAK
jgi:hypothetical protein